MKSIHNGVLAILLLFSLLWGEGSDFDMLKVHSKILPRILQMSLPAPSDTAPELLCLLYDPIDAENAYIFAKLLNVSVRRAQGFELMIKMASYAHMQTCMDAQALFLFDTNPATLRAVRKMVGERPVFVAAYSAQLLEEGADYSLSIGRTVQPYLNLKTLAKKGIIPKPLLIRISKIYVQKEER